MQMIFLNRGEAIRFFYKVFRTLDMIDISLSKEVVEDIVEEIEMQLGHRMSLLSLTEKGIKIDIVDGLVIYRLDPFIENKYINSRFPRVTEENLDSLKDQMYKEFLEDQKE